jgi:hypothetical protein
MEYSVMIAALSFGAVQLMITLPVEESKAVTTEAIWLGMALGIAVSTVE